MKNKGLLGQSGEKKSMLCMLLEMQLGASKEGI
jgi:hypothetical protein